MSQALTIIKSLILNHKMKYFVALVSFVFFGIALFPYGDLSDLVTAQVSKHSGNQVYLQFEDMGISVIPQPSLSLDKVRLETPVLPSLSAGSLSVAPSIGALLTFKKGFILRASDFLKGDVYLNFREGDKKDKSFFQNIELDISDLELAEVKSLVTLPVNPKGKSHLELDLQFDTNLIEQPSGELTLSIHSLKIPPATVPTAFGPMALPKIKFSKINLTGRLVNGDFIIDQGQFGEGSDGLKGRVKGKLAVQIKKRGANIKPIFGAYELKIQINMDKSAQGDFGLFMGFIDSKYKTQTNQGSRFQFKLTGLRWGPPPKFSPTGKF